MSSARVSRSWPGRLPRCSWPGCSSMPFAGDKSHLLATSIAMCALFWLEPPFDWTT